MKPYTKIKQALKVIEDMKSDLTYSKNKVKDAERINILLTALKSFDDMMIYKFKTNAIEQLMSALIYELLIIHKVYEGNPIPIHEIKETFSDCFTYHSDYKKEQIISVLKSHEMKNIINNYENSFDITTFEKDFINTRTDKEWYLLLNELINAYKFDIQWTLNK